MKKIFGLMTLIFLFSTINALADETLPPTPKPAKTPKQVKAIDTRLSISISKNYKEARLLIPKSQIKQLRAELAELDGEDSSEVASAQTNFARTQTIVGGLFLSLAFVTGGVWFARSHKNASKTSKTIAAGTVLLLSGAFAAIAFANIGPPPEARSITNKLFSEPVLQYRFASGKIKLEASDETDELKLEVPIVDKVKDDYEE